jgi:uncharacterized protein
MAASVQVTYPGVYIQEIPSGNITITGVATSITAFVGRTIMGPAEPTDCFGYADFERYFGGRAFGYPLGYAVEDFFQNGGTHAIIVRVFKAKESAVKAADKGNGKQVAADQDKAAPEDKTAVKDTDTGNANPTHESDSKKAVTDQAEAPPPDGLAAAEGGGLTLVAASPGKWASDHLTMTIKVAPAPAEDTSKDANPATPKKSLADLAVAPFKRYGLEKSDLFTLTLTYTMPDGRQTIERFQNVTIKGDAAPIRLDRVLEAQSQLARVLKLPKDTPSANVGPVAFKGGDDSAALTATDLLGDPLQRTGIYALDHVDMFNLLCIPPDPKDADYDHHLEKLYQDAAVYCLNRRAMLIVDPPKAWSDPTKQGHLGELQPTDLGITSALLEARNCAVYFPRIKKLDPETGQIDVFPACGALAGIYAATDNSRGVWKAPAGITAGIGGITGLEYNLTDEQNGQLNPLGINCLRNFPIIGPVVWGARTLRGADILSDDYKYIPVRRLTLYIEESLYRGTKFAVFEPNDETLWSQLRLSIGAFMADLARQGAFYGYNVACDKSTTTPYFIDRGIVNVRVAFAPVKPAEFIVLQIQQQAGQTAS